MQPGRHTLGTPTWASGPRARFDEAVQVVPLDLVEPQYSRQRVEHLRRRMRVAAAFEAQVVVGADAREHRDLLAS